MPYRAILLDLFRTVVWFTPRAPTLRVDEPTWGSAMRRLREDFRAVLPDVDFEEFLEVSIAVSHEIASGRAPEFREVSATERYRRILARLPGHEGDEPEKAAAMVSIQMQAFVENTILPPEHARLLHDLAQRYRLAVVSNFDDGPTVERVLARHGIRSLYASKLVSIDFGRRKPHPSIFLEALRQLDVTPAQALHVGDSLDADVAGARRAGIAAVWLNPAREPVPVRGPHPEYEIASLEDLRPLLL